MNLYPYVFWTIAGLWAATLVVHAPSAFRWYVACVRRREVVPTRPRGWSHVRVVRAPYDWERDEAGS